MHAPVHFAIINKSDQSKSKPEWFYLPQQLSLTLKYNALGINAHLRNSIENEFVNLGQLWFAEYLRPSQPKGVIASFSIQEKKTSISSSVSFDESRLFIRNSSTRNWTSRAATFWEGGTLGRFHSRDTKPKKKKKISLEKTLNVFFF